MQVFTPDRRIISIEDSHLAFENSRIGGSLNYNSAFTLTGDLADFNYREYLSKYPDNVSLIRNDAPPLSGGCLRVRGYKFYTSDYRIPVDPYREFRFVCAAKVPDDAPNDYIRVYTGVTGYDIDGLRINSYQYTQLEGSVDATLTEDLKYGDTVVHVSDTTGWYNGDTLGNRCLVIWPKLADGSVGYVADAGYIYRPESKYTGLYRYNAWPEGGINGNDITLASAWNGDTIPAGSVVRNYRAGGTYLYYTSNAYVYKADGWKILTSDWKQGEYLTSAAPAYVPGAFSCSLIGLFNYAAGVDDLGLYGYIGMQSRLL